MDATKAEIFFLGSIDAGKILFRHLKALFSGCKKLEKYFLLKPPF